MAVNRTPVLKRCRSLGLDPVYLGYDKKSKRELKRAKAAGVKLFLLIQDKDYYIKLLKGEYISHVHPNASAAMVISLMAKFDNLHIIACDRKESPSMVHKILYYHLREEIKRKEGN